MRQVIILVLAMICQIGISQKTDSELLNKNSEIKNIQQKKYSETKAGDESFYAANTLLAKAKTIEEKNMAFDELHKSALSGSSRAMHMIGNYYKYGIIVDQSLQEAVAYFNEAIDMGLNEALYSRGYMYYKGLGCEQNYFKAVEDFRMCALDGNASCMYMLGLCHRNGFGIQKNEEIGNEWLKKASEFGNFVASREISFKTPEINNKVLNLLNQEKSAEVIEVIKNPEVNEFNRIHDIEGMLTGKSFNGYWLTYDYSLEHIIDVKEMILSFAGNDSHENTVDISGDVYNFDYRLDGGELKVFNLSIDRKDRYIDSKSDSLEIRSFECQSMFTDSTIILSGIVDAYSSLEKEPGRIAEIIVTRPKEIQVTVSDAVPSIIVSPNPSFTDQMCNVEISIYKKDNYKIEVTDMKGAIYYLKENILEVGDYSFPLELDFKQGAYIVTVSSENLITSTKILKI